jgi:RHS repeat-associated protein
VTVLDGNGTPRTVNESLYGNPWTFTGRRLDQETGLMYFRFRYYDTGLGRFIGRDPLGYVDGANMYQYCFSDPLNFTDPFGLFTSILTLVGNQLYSSSEKSQGGDGGPGHTAIVRDAAGAEKNGILPEGMTAKDYPSGKVVATFEFRGWRFVDYKKYVDEENEKRCVYESNISSEVDDDKIDAEIKKNLTRTYMDGGNDPAITCAGIVDEIVKVSVVPPGTGAWKPAFTSTPAAIAGAATTLTGEQPQPANKKAKDTGPYSDTNTPGVGRGFSLP